MRSAAFLAFALAATAPVASADLGDIMPPDVRVDPPLVGGSARGWSSTAGRTAGRNMPRGHSPGTRARRRWKRARAAGRAK